MGRLPDAVPARQEFLGLQPAGQPTESGGTESAGFDDDRMLRDAGGHAAGSGAGVLLEAGGFDQRFAAFAGFSPADAGLRSDAAAAIQGAVATVLFAEPFGGAGIFHHGRRNGFGLQPELQLYDEFVP